MAHQPIGITELHLHLEGSLPLRSAIEIGASRGHAWGSMTPAQLRKRLVFTSLNDFLGAVRDMAQILCSTEALERAARELSAFLADNGVRYAEVYSSPYIYVRWGLDYGEVLRAVDRGFAAGEANGGCSCRILLDSVRQWGPEIAELVLRSFDANRVDRVIGFGIGGEESYPLEGFAGAFELARSLGLRTVAHAGESSDASDVRKAIDLLKVDRVAHGIRAIDDADLVAELARRQVPLDIAVTSNYKTGATRGRHPIGRLSDAGIPVTLSTDDPALFCTNLRREYSRAVRLGGLSAGDLRTVARNGIAFSFAPPDLKERLHAELDQRLSSAGATIEAVRRSS